MRSSHAMSTSPALNSGRSRIASRKARLVVPSSMITVDLAQGAAQARGRLLARAAVGDDLGHHRVEVGRDDVAGGDAAVHAHAGAGREVQHLHAARRGREAHRGVLGVQARLDRVADGLRRLALELAAGGHVQLQLDQVQAGDGLGDRVLDLQARVDLHEGEALLGGLVEELDRAGVAVAGLQREPARGLLDLLLLLAREHDATRTPRRPSGGGAGTSSRARRPPRPDPGRRRSAAPRCGARCRPSPP